MRERNSAVNITKPCFESRRRLRMISAQFEPPSRAAPL